jgi:hypothetical protein
MRIDQIHRELRDRPAVRLPKKLFVGHWRYLAVRQDVLRSSIGGQVQMVVDKCNHWVLGRKGNDKSYRATTEVPIGTGSSGFSQGQGLRPLSKSAWEEAEFPEFFERKWFRKVTSLLRAGTKNIPIERFFPQVPERMLEYAYKPAYVCETSLVDGELESELKRLYDFMRDAHGWVKIEGRRVDEWDLSLRKRRWEEVELERERREHVH